MQSIAQIKERLTACPASDLPALLLEYEADSRKGVQNLLARFQKIYQQAQAEQQRLEAMLTYEKAAYQNGYTYIAGIDEVGRGPLAGPVVAAAVILPQNHKIPFVNDSKQLSAQKRAVLAEQIKKEALAYAIGIIPNERIDEINILQATYEAMRQALSQLSVQPDFILADAVTIPKITIPQQSIIKGDAKSLSIAAASILAKVTRDAMMEEMANVYPHYDFASNKGYGSQKHIAGIAQYGLCPIHRRSFVGKILQRQNNSTEKGNVGQALAVREMQKHGYVILEQNYRSGHGEIDIIAQKEDVIVFTEVKRRTSDSHGIPAEAVDQKKRTRILHTAQAYLALREWYDCPCRFDIAEILEQDGQTYFRYTENAFGEEDTY